MHLEGKEDPEVMQIPGQKVFIGDIAVLFERFLELEHYSHVIVLVDEHTKQYCLPIIKPILKAPCTIVEITSGEQHKTIETCLQVWAGMLHAGADRKSLCINLGGGVIGDLGGFCAATFMRGMSFIQVPTTVLAMADASVGGKLGVDFQFAKNYIGLFQVPDRVFIDPQFLRTLPSRHLRNGMAEVLKHGLIADKAFFEQLTERDDWQFENGEWQEILFRSIRVKANIVSRDQREFGERKKLNFGHTIGHAIESAFLSEKLDLLHGEAIVAGMIMESFISVETGLIGHHELEQISAGFLKHYDKIQIDQVAGKEILAYIRKDKKKQGGNVQYTLLDGIGRASIDHKVDPELELRALDYYNSLS